MNAATAPRADAERLLVVDPVSRAIDDRRVDDLPRLLRAGDVLVVNDAATLPASLVGRTAAGAPLELRLLGRPRRAATGPRWRSATATGARRRRTARRRPRWRSVTRSRSRD